VTHPSQSSIVCKGGIKGVAEDIFVIRASSPELEFTFTTNFYGISASAVAGTCIKA
jgi:hypothetical protein